MRSQDLFGTPPHMLARNNDPETSHEAAVSIDTTKLEMLVYNTIKYAPFDTGMTQDEILLMFPYLSYSSITARPCALIRKGLIFVKGDKRKGRSGRNQRILRPERRRNPRQ